MKLDNIVYVLASAFLAILFFAGSVGLSVLLVAVFFTVFPAVLIAILLTSFLTKKMRTLLDRIF